MQNQASAARKGRGGFFLACVGRALLPATAASAAGFWLTQQVRSGGPERPQQMGLKNNL